MGDLSVKHEQARRRDLPKNDEKRTPQERAALMTLRSEARKNGAQLATGGKGGLPSTLVLAVMRRDGYHCKACGLKENLSIHHKGGIVESEWLSKKGHKLEKNNLVTICQSCHDRIHNKAREEGVDSSQVLPEADKGDARRDHGQPDADPPK